MGFVPLRGQAAARKMFICDGVRIGFGADGSITTLRGRQAWASEAKPLGKFTYQTITAQDFFTFNKDFGQATCTPQSSDIGCHNFMKPNMTSAGSGK